MKINFWPLRNVQQCKLLCLIALTPRNKTIFKRCIQYYPAILSHQWFYLHSLIHTYNLTFILHIYLLSIVTQWGFYAFMTICNNMVLWRAIENITVYHMIFWSLKFLFITLLVGIKEVYIWILTSILRD